MLIIYHLNSLRLQCFYFIPDYYFELITNCDEFILNCCILNYFTPVRKKDNSPINFTVRTVIFFISFPGVPFHFTVRLSSRRSSGYQTFTATRFLHTWLLKFKVSICNLKLSNSEMLYSSPVRNQNISTLFKVQKLHLKIFHSFL